jgi:hypothetical protein
MPDIVPIPYVDLLVDALNPRLPNPNLKQREIQRALARTQDRKLAVLAKDIVDHGLSPSELPIVMQLPTDPKQFVVLEGNRRLTALKALENPNFLEGAVDAAVLKELKKLSERYLAGDPTVLYGALVLGVASAVIFL